ncbi:hypothetical protein ACEPAH_8758 [Sanghuangporus vaninii]
MTTIAAFLKDNIGYSKASSPSTSSMPLQHPTIVHVNGKDSLHENTTGMDVDEGEGDEYSDDTSAGTVEVDELDESDYDEPRPQWRPVTRLPPGFLAEHAAATATASAAAAPAKPAPVVKKPRPKPPTTRVPGQTIVPMSRIEAILSADAGQNGAHSKEASYLISLATEEFVRRLTRVAHSRSRLDKRSLTTYNDIADSAFYFDEYNFLQEMIPRPLTPKVALAERKRILEEQEALLHGVGVEGADSAATKSKNTQVPASAMTSKASTPVPRLSKPVATPNTSINGKSSKSKSSTANTNPPVIRSERQKLKKARESQAAHESSANGHMPPPPSPAEKGIKSEDATVNGSATSNKIGSVKIKIRPRVSSTPRSAAPANSPAASPPVLPLGPPPSQSSSTHSKDRESIRRSSKVYSSRHGGKEKEADAPAIVFEEHEKSGVKYPNANGRPVQFAPVGVDTAGQPLWTRTPLPPPQSTSKVKTDESQRGRTTSESINKGSGKPAASSTAVDEPSEEKERSSMPKNPSIQVLPAEETMRTKKVSEDHERLAARKNISDTAKDTRKTDPEQFRTYGRPESQQPEDHSIENGETEKSPQNGGSSPPRHPSIYDLSAEEMMRTKEIREDRERHVARKDMSDTAKGMPKIETKESQADDRAEPQQPDEHSIKNGEKEKPPENGGLALQRPPLSEGTSPEVLNKRSHGRRAEAGHVDAPSSGGSESSDKNAHGEVIPEDMRPAKRARHRQRSGASSSSSKVSTRETPIRAFLNNTGRTIYSKR